VSEETIAMHCLMVCLNYIPIFVLRMRQIALYGLRGSLATVALPVSTGLARGFSLTERDERERERGFQSVVLVLAS